MDHILYVVNKSTIETLCLTNSKQCAFIHSIQLYSHVQYCTEWHTKYTTVTNIRVECGKTSIGQTKLNIYCISFQIDLHILLQTMEIT